MPAPRVGDIVHQREIGMTAPKSYGVLTTRKRSGQVKPSNSISSARRTSLRAPSAPISQPPRRASVRPLRATATSTPCASCATLTSASNSDREMRMGLQPVAQDLRQLRLLALHAVGMTGDDRPNTRSRTLQAAQQLCAKLKLRRLQALRDQRLRGTDVMQHVERRRVESRRPRLVVQRRPRLEHRYRHAVAYQIGRRDEPDRARTDNQHAIFSGHDSPRLIRSWRCRPW